MKKLLLVALMLAGIATFAAPTLVVDVMGTDLSIVDKGDVTRVTPIKGESGDVECISLCFAIDGEQTVKTTVATKSSGLRLRPSMGVGTFEVKSVKANGKELLTRTETVDKANWLSGLEAKSENGQLELVLQVSAK